RKGCALRRHDVADAGHEAGDEVKLAFAHNRKLRLKYGTLGFIEAEKDFAFLEDVRLRGVDILGRFLVAAEHASAEGNHAPLLIADREDEPASKPIVVSTAFFLNDQASLLDEREVITLAPGQIDCVIPSVRRVAESK